MDSIKILNFNIENSYDYEVSGKVFEDGTYEFLISYYYSATSKNDSDLGRDIKLYIDYTKKIEKIIIETSSFSDHYAYGRHSSNDSKLFDNKEKIENFMNTYKDDEEVDMINQILGKITLNSYTI